MVSVWGDLLYPQSLCLELPPGTFPQRPCLPSTSDPIQQQLEVFSCLTIMLFAHTGKRHLWWILTFKCHSIAVASRSINARCYETERASRSCRRSRSTLKLQRISRFGDIKEGVCTAINDLACSKLLSACAHPCRAARSGDTSSSSKLDISVSFDTPFQRLSSEIIPI